jgi:hypothetical protein
VPVRAWWAYWLTIGVAAVLWIGVPLVAGRDGLLDLLHQPLGLAILLLPLVAAGINLIAYRGSHEEVCRLEVERHPSLRYLVGRGYSARTFAWTGGALLVLAAVIVVGVVESG